jgi:hypothetical protein
MMADVSYTEVMRLAEQLSPQEQAALIAHLQQLAQHQQLTKEQRKALLEASILDIPFINEPSPRREDWYDDDGR